MHCNYKKIFTLLLCLYSSMRPNVKYDLQHLLLVFKIDPRLQLSGMTLRVISFWRRLFTLLSFQWPDCYIVTRSKSEITSFMEITRVELVTSCLQSRRSPSWAISPFTNLRWWAYVELHHRPHPYQGCALTNWAIGPLYTLFTNAHEI